MPWRARPGCWVFIPHCRSRCPKPTINTPSAGVSVAAVKGERVGMINFEGKYTIHFNGKDKHMKYYPVLSYVYICLSFFWIIFLEHGHWNSGFRHETWWFSRVFFVFAFYQRVNPQKIPSNQHFPMVFPWFSHGFPMVLPIKIWRPDLHSLMGWPVKAEGSLPGGHVGRSGSRNLGIGDAIEIVGDRISQDHWDHCTYITYIYIS